MSAPLPQVRSRCTITSKDSSADDARLGTLEHCAHVLLHIIEMCPAAQRAALVEVLLQLGEPAREAALEAIERHVEVRADRRASGGVHCACAGACHHDNIRFL